MFEYRNIGKIILKHFDESIKHHQNIPQKYNYLNNQNYFEEFTKEDTLEITNYFQTGIMFYDTSIIKEETKEEIINLVEKYPISTTNEQGIMNLYFIYIENFYEDLPVRTNDGLVYYYWLIELFQQKFLIVTDLLF